MSYPQKRITRTSQGKRLLLQERYFQGINIYYERINLKNPERKESKEMNILLDVDVLKLNYL